MMVIESVLDTARLDLDTAQQAIRLLEFENQRLHKRLELLTRELAALRNQDATVQLELELMRLREQVADMQHRLFGAKSEKQPQAADKCEQAGTVATETAPRRRGHGPTPQPRLPIVERFVSLPEGERTCDACGRQLDEWKGQFETSELINVVQRKFVIEKVQRHKYRCQCQSTIVCAPAPLKLVPGGRYSLEFAVEVAVDKYLDHLPLNRQVARMRREGLYATTQTLCDQTARLAQTVVYCYDAIGDGLILNRVLHMDETTWWLLNTKPSKRWYVWCMANREGVYYRISPSRSSKVALDMLEHFEGTLVTDAYKVYVSLANKPGTPFEVVFCWAHARRKLITAERSYPQCTEAIELIRGLYEVERRVPEPAIDADEELRARAREMRAALRDNESRCITKLLFDWAQEQRGVPGSSLRKATDYLVNHWTPLTAFLDDPDIPLDNNLVERQLRSPVIGRKNHLGSRSEDGAHVAEILYTLIHSAVMVGVDPRRYLLEAARRALEEPGAVLLPHELKEPDS